MIQKSVQEYRKLDVLSSSDLRTFSLDRRKFYRSIVLKEGGEDEDYNKSLLIGDIVHTLLLEPHNFDDKYFLSICPDPPTGNMLAFTEALYKHTILNTDDEGNVIKEFEDIAREAYVESGFKWTLDRVLKNFKDSNAELYYKELREAKTGNKTVVCIADLSISEKIVETLKTHQYTADIFNQEEDDNHLVFNEFQVEEFTLYDLKLKAMLDKVIINTDTKIVTIYDLKVVWDPVNFYRDYYLKRRAYIQALVYYNAVKNADFGIDLSDYTINYPIFIACDSANFYSPIKYFLTADHHDNAVNGFWETGRWYEGLLHTVRELLWCQEHQDWRTTKEIFQNNGLLKLG